MKLEGSKKTPNYVRKIHFHVFARAEHESDSSFCRESREKLRIVNNDILVSDPFYKNDGFLEKKTRTFAFRWDIGKIVASIVVYGKKYER